MGITIDEFKYGLGTSGCMFSHGKTWYEENELIEAFKDLGLIVDDKATVEAIPKDQYEARLKADEKIRYKYLKIEEIVNDWLADGGAFEMTDIFWLDKIRSVIEDGENNRH